MLILVHRQWREKQAADIKKRDEMSERRREEIKRQANQSIDDFYMEHKERVERSIKENKCVCALCLFGSIQRLTYCVYLQRLREEEFQAGLTDGLSAGTTWSRICETIELDNSQSKTIARTGAGTTDLGRYKEVLLRLKREGENAPGAAGY
jgi:Clathrin light chain